MNMNNFREEIDSMGIVKVLESAYWGAQTERAHKNFAVSPYRLPVSMLQALALIKKSAAISNSSIGNIDSKYGDAIVKAASEIQEGSFVDQFPLDVFQTGSGTSWNMNINEVLANRANELLGGERGDRSLVHPNDHVNKGQSSNDVIPTAINISSRIEAERCAEAIEALALIVKEKEVEFKDVIKLGRTHLQDAVPMRLSDEFSAWRVQLEKSAKRIRSTFASLEELALGGTAIGSGLNCSSKFVDIAIENIVKESGISFHQADNLYEAISARDSSLELMNALNSTAVVFMKIAQDLRILSSGPRSGIGEINLPSLQPGSSIMPGKINPVIPEMVIQSAAFIMGKHTSVTIATQNSPLQLNIMMPLIAHELHSSLDLIKNVANSFGRLCFKGITANRELCKDKIEWSLAIITPLATTLGYDKAAEIAHYAWEKGIKVSEAASILTELTQAQLDDILDIKKMV